MTSNADHVENAATLAARCAIRTGTLVFIILAMCSLLWRAYTPVDPELLADLEAGGWAAVYVHFLFASFWLLSGATLVMLGIGGFKWADQVGR